MPGTYENALNTRLRNQFIDDIADMRKAYEGFDRKTLKEPLPQEFANLLKK